MKKKKENTWYPCDSSTHKTPEITGLLNKYGANGYGCWKILLEVLREEPDYKINIQRPFIYEALATDVRMQEDAFRLMLTDMIEVYDIIQTDGKHIWCNYLSHRMKYLENKRAALSENGKRGAAVTNSKRTAKAQQTAANAGDKPQPISAQNKTIQNNNKTIQNTTIQNNNNTQQNTTTENEASVVVVDFFEEDKNNHTEPKTVLKEDKDKTACPAADGIAPVAPPPEGTWQQMKQRALADRIRFVYPLVTSGKVSEQELSLWLDAFNRVLDIRAEPMKPEQDYRRHFLNWFKYRNPAREDPRTYPANAAATPARPTLPNANTYIKSAAEVAEKQRRDMEEIQQKIARGEPIGMQARK